MVKMINAIKEHQFPGLTDSADARQGAWSNAADAYPARRGVGISVPLCGENEIHFYLWAISSEKKAISKEKELFGLL
jgi:hypothetical protein